MGWFFSPALRLLEKTDQKSIPIAWALNGFASVIASPLAVIFSIASGFVLPLILAVFLYLLSFLIFNSSLNKFDVDN